MKRVVSGKHIMVDISAKKLGVVILIIANGFYIMKIAIKLIVIACLLVSCDAILSGDRCDSEASFPYSKDEVGETHCNNKCCEFIVHAEMKTCHEMWCYRDCHWNMTHDYCY